MHFYYNELFKTQIADWIRPLPLQNMNFKVFNAAKIRNISAKCSYLLAICAFFIPPAVAQHKNSYQPDKKYAPEQLKKDFSLLRTAIEQFHPGAFLYLSRDSVSGSFDDYAASLVDSLTERQFRNQLMAVTEIIKCGHAAINSSDERQRFFKKRPFRVLPLELSFIDSQLYILKNYSKDSSLRAGLRVLSIENRPTVEIYGCMFAANGSDGYNMTNRVYAFQHGVQFQYNRFYPEKDSFKLELKDSLNLMYNVRCPAMLSDSFTFTKAKFQKGIYNNARNRFFVDSSNQSTALMDLYAEEIFGYRRFYRRCFRYLKRHNVKKLVIDLRGNGGGFLLNPGDLLSYLIDCPDHLEVIRAKKVIPFKAHLRGHKYVGITELFFPFLPNVERDKSDSGAFHIMVHFRPKRKWHYNGKVFVLIDGGTFSAASCIAAYLKKYKRATFIGQETGGAESGCNAFLTPYLILPETKLKYLLPLYRIENNVLPEKIGRGIFPDIETRYRLEDFLNGRDLEMLEFSKM